MWELRGSDLALVRDQLGREPLTRFAVVVRCGDGHPLVIRNHPRDREGAPFPTLYWLTCPDAVRAVSRVEAEGWIKRLDDGAGDDPGFADALESAHRSYAAERERWEPGARGWGGVAGTARGVKCLHAHYAHHLAGGEDPVGAWTADRVEPVHPAEDRTGRVAAMDVGTNSVRLLVAGRVELARDMVITRLGRGVDRVGRLEAASVAATLDVLGTYARRARRLGAERMRIGCTSAVRDAANRDEFLRRVEEETGAAPEVLDGLEEAELSFRGASSGLDARPPFLVFDIGGGSTELALGAASVDRSISVDIGSVRLTERVGPDDPPSEDDVTSMRRIAGRELETAPIAAARAATLVGVAGTTTTVQALALGLDRYDPDAIHRSVLTRQAAEEQARRLAAMTTAERRALPVMAPGREDVIVAGTQILLAILERWGPEGCLVSERDILDGLALSVREDGR